MPTFHVNEHGDDCNGGSDSTPGTSYYFNGTVQAGSPNVIVADLDEEAEGIICPGDPIWTLNAGEAAVARTVVSVVGHDVTVTGAPLTAGADRSYVTFQDGAGAKAVVLATVDAGARKVVTLPFGTWASFGVAAGQWLVWDVFGACERREVESVDGASLVVVGDDLTPGVNPQARVGGALASIDIAANIAEGATVHVRKGASPYPGNCYLATSSVRIVGYKDAPGDAEQHVGDRDYLPVIDGGGSDTVGIGWDGADYVTVANFLCRDVADSGVVDTDGDCGGYGWTVFNVIAEGCGGQGIWLCDGYAKAVCSEAHDALGAGFYVPNGTVAFCKASGNAIGQIFAWVAVNCTAWDQPWNEEAPAAPIEAFILVHCTADARDAQGTPHYHPMAAGVMAINSLGFYGDYGVKFSDAGAAGCALNCMGKGQTGSAIDPAFAFSVGCQAVTGQVVESEAARDYRLSRGSPARRAGFGGADAGACQAPTVDLAEVHLLKAVTANKRKLEIATGVLTIYDDDGQTVLATVTPSETGGVLRIAPTFGNRPNAAVPDVELHAVKAALCNLREHTIETGVDAIMDDDGETELLTLTPSEANGVITVEPG